MSDTRSGQPFVIWVEGDLTAEEANRLSADIQSAVAPILESVGANPERAEADDGAEVFARDLQTRLLADWDKVRLGSTMGMVARPRLDPRAR